MAGGVLLALAFLIASPGAAEAQVARYELGRRVRAFERDWDRTPDPVKRREASKSLERAVAAFLSLRLPEAGRYVDAAHAALLGETAPDDDPARRWANALAVVPAARLFDPARGELGVTLEAFDPSAATPIPEGARIRLGFVREGEEAPRPGTALEAGLTTLPATGRIATAGLPPGDHALRGEFLVGGRVVGASEVGVSVVERAGERLEAARSAVAAWPSAPEADTTNRATARGMLRILTSLQGGFTLENDVPAAKRLAELEEIVAADAAGRTFLGPDLPGDYWVTLATPARREVAARVFVPEAAREGRPLPLVVALHGAGGSENMFFDAYGAGAVVRLCRERGWLLASPRGGVGAAPVEDVVDALAALYPVDPDRVFLVGHSMGASQAVAAAVRAPGRFAGVAALGGSGRARKVEGLERLPFFIGVGTLDFARGGAGRLARELPAAGAPEPTFREYEGVEHMTIVPVALPDAFAFFDAIAGR